MKITDLLDKRSISLDASPKTKSEALDQIVALMAESGKINDEEAYRRQVYAREEEITTGMARELPFLMESAVPLQNQVWQPW